VPQTSPAASEPIGSKKKKRKFFPALGSLAVNAGATFGVAFLWFYPLLTLLKPDTTAKLSPEAAAVALIPTISVVGGSIILGGYLRWQFARTKSALSMITAALFGPLAAGWAAAASSDLRASLTGLPGDGGLISLAYFGAWLVTFTYLMKLPWDRSTEIIRDKINARSDPDKPCTKCICPKCQESTALTTPSAPPETRV